MSVELFLIILFTSSIATIVLTEALKKLLNASETPYRANAVALDSAMVCSTLIALIFKTALGLGLSLSVEQVTRLLSLILSTWFVSMFVYDKMVQFRKQHKKVKELSKGGKANDSERATGETD